MMLWKLYIFGTTLENDRFQIEYAACDAFVGVYAFWKLVSAKIEGNSSAFCEPNAENWAKVLSFCQGLFDVGFKESRDHASQFRVSKAQLLYFHVELACILCKFDFVNFVQKSKPKPKVSKECVSDPVVSKAYSVRKTPLYHGSTLHAPDGQLLCMCDTSKAQWYISKGLAGLLHL